MVCFLLLSCSPQTTNQASTTIDANIRNNYLWQPNYKPEDKMLNRIAPPKGYTRIAYPERSFADWLRNLPLLPGTPDVLLYNGKPKGNQSVHYAVVNIDVGNTDLQQCADAVMRLRAEYLLSVNRVNDIHFKFTNGFDCTYSKWRQGYRIKVNGNDVSWYVGAGIDTTYTAFKSYMKQVFTYSGTLSLSRELKNIYDFKNIKPGDVFIHGGSPGHAVIVVDVAQNAKGEKVFMLAQSYMPAQQIHILVNPGNNATPWYSVNDISANQFITAEYIFYNPVLAAW